jgi:spore maturation protein SpmB
MSDVMTSYLVKLTRLSLATFWELIKIMVPIMILLRIAESLGWIDMMVPWFEPAMSWLNLPAEAALIFITSALMGNYGAIAAFPVLIGHEVTAAQITSISMFILIAHALPIEQAIVRKAGASFWGTVILRLAVGILACWLIDLIAKTTGYLNEPQSIEHFKYLGQPDVGHLEWAMTSLQGLGFLFVILVALLVGLDLLDWLNVTKWINKLLSPLLKISGLDPSVTPITTTGILLGLSYGGGLIIARANDGSISRAARFYSLCWLSLCHSLIEDTAIMVAVGGDVWMLLFGRLVLTFIVIRLLMLWFDKKPFRRNQMVEA